MMTIQPYLNFPGNTEEAFLFYQSIFGGEFLALQRFKEMPAAANFPEDIQEKIMHIALPIGKDTVLMATDSVEPLGTPLTYGNNFHLVIQTESREEANTYFARLSEGGKVIMPIEDAFWGDYFGMLTDPFGVHWMVTCNNKQPQSAPAEASLLKEEVPL